MAGLLPASCWLGALRLCSCSGLRFGAPFGKQCWLPLSDTFTRRTSSLSSHSAISTATRQTRASRGIWLSDGFVADDDAAGRQQLLHHAQPEREAEISPRSMADDLGREPIPGVASASGCPHPTRLLTPICSRKRSKARQVDGAENKPFIQL